MVEKRPSFFSSSLTTFPIIPIFSRTDPCYKPTYVGTSNRLQLYELHLTDEWFVNILPLLRYANFSAYLYTYLYTYTAYLDQCFNNNQQTRAEPTNHEPCSITQHELLLYTLHSFLYFLSLGGFLESNSRTIWADYLLSACSTIPIFHFSVL